MPSPSTSTLRSGTIAESRFSGGGALEKSWITRLGCCCWNGAKNSPPNQPRAAGRGGAGGPPKLKNCAEAGPTIPTNSAIATASATSGPGSVNTRKNGFGFCIQSGRKDDPARIRYSIGIRPQAGGFSVHKRGIGPGRQGHGQAVVCQGYV